MKKIVAFLFAVVAILSLAACDAPNKDLTVAEKEEQLVSAFVAFMNSSTGKQTIKNNDGIVSISSSDKSWEDLTADHPVVELDNSDVTLKFGGSTSVEKIAKALSAQFAPLAGNFVASHNHTGSGDAFKRTQGSEKDGANGIHIGFASRAFNSEEEVGPAATRGRLAIDAVVAIVHKDNTLSNITKAGLAAVYTGTNVPAELANLKAYARDASSGTREAFLGALGLKTDLKETEEPVKATQVSGNGTMLSGVAADAQGIGYASLASIAANNNVKGLSFEGVAATEATVIDGTYKMQRPFMYIVRNYAS